ncbi:DUF2599 domain-containing protein [Frankia sp. Ag45/Mut15]|uniref:DUF2599 domain-containing protein n=1 Tax=Frankia umida TaxID=573489 RepID=A0ABT0K0H6_9ACTN|nr:DUF2599 domain-containing protein [Frankia umida]MCK9877310.1 DUF2599 domain-containing protein [Frankia umida]
MRTFTVRLISARAAARANAAMITAGMLLVLTLAGCGGHDADDQDARDRPVAITEITPTATASRSTPTPTASRAASRAATAGASTRPGSAAGLVGAGAAAGGRPYCGASRDVEEIVVESWSSGAFRVSLRPTVASRKAPRTATTQVLWSAIGACVPGVGTAASAESLHQQLACHQALAQIRSGDGYATGDTYDLESWRPPMTPNSFPTWISTRCGNTLGTDPAGGPARVYRPDGVAARYPVRGEHG